MVEGSPPASSLVEIRPGRKIYIEVIDTDDNNKKKTQPNKPGAPVILFVHGSCAHSGQWDFQVDWLLQRQKDLEQQQKLNNGSNDHVRIVRYDYLGCGKSSKPEENAEAIYGASEHYADLVAVYDRFCSNDDHHNNKNNNNVWVVAHSFGCSMALRLAHEKGSRGGVSKLVLVAPAPHPLGVPWIVTHLPLWLLGWMQPLLTKGFVAAAFCPETFDRNPHLVETETAASNANPPYMFRAFYRSMEAYQNSAEANEGARSEWIQSVKRTVGAVWIVFGKEDRIVSPDSGQQLREALDTADPSSSEWCRWSVVENASHQVFQEQPDRVNALLAACFFGGNSSKAEEEGNQEAP